MSEKAAQSCEGKKRHRSERKADEVARHTQKLAGVPMKSYYCDYCKGFHVGSVQVKLAEELTPSRAQRKQAYTNHDRNRLDKVRFNKIKV